MLGKSSKNSRKHIYFPLGNPRTIKDDLWWMFWIVLKRAMLLWTIGNDDSRILFTLRYPGVHPECIFLSRWTLLVLPSVDNPWRIPLAALFLQNFTLYMNKSNYEATVCAHSAVNRVFLTCLYVIRQVTVIYSYKREWISIVTSNRLCSNA